MLSTASGFSEEMPNDNDVERGLLQDPAAADEERQYGRVPRRLYWLYARSCGFFLTICFFIGSVGWQSARLGTDYFLVVYKIETSANQTSINNSNQEGTGSNYLMIYTALSVVSVILALTANILGQVIESIQIFTFYFIFITYITLSILHIFVARLQETKDARVCTQACCLAYPNVIRDFSTSSQRGDCSTDSALICL